MSWTGRKDRSRARFEADLLPHLQPLNRFARALATPVEAEDLVQATCIRALERFDAYAPGTNLRAWLFTILRNESASRRRRGHREREVESGGVAMAPPHDVEPSLETLLMRQRWSEEVRAALLSLPAAYRLPVYLKDVEGFGYRDIALVAGCPLGTVMSRLARGRALLRTALLRQAAERGLVRASLRTEAL